MRIEDYKQTVLRLNLLELEEFSSSSSAKTLINRREKTVIKLLAYEPSYDWRRLQKIMKENHPNLMSIIDFFLVKDNELKTQYICVEAELIDGIKLRDYMANFSLTFEINRIIKDILCGLKFLHHYNIIHGDIKPENIILSSGTTKLIDLDGVSLQNEIKKDTFATPEYISPELLKEKKMTTKTDIWSVGCLIYEIIHGQPPFGSRSSHDSTDRIFERIKNHEINLSGTPQPYKDLIDLCFRRYNDRPSAIQILKLKYL